MLAPDPSASYLVVRGDSGFCRPRVLRRLERWGVDYVLGLQKNTRLLQRTELAELALAEQYQARGTKQRFYGSFDYAADSWDRQRRVVARLEHGPQGANPRFIVTSLRGEPKYLYDKRYCARGEADNPRRVSATVSDVLDVAVLRPPVQ